MRCDCHIHMLLDGAYWRTAIARHSDSPDLSFIHAALKTYQSQGFTYLRDGGDRWGAGLAARELASQYGITYRTPLSPLHLQGHYGSFIGTAFANLKEYAALVRSHRDQGADFIKIMISGLMDFHHWGVLTEEGLPPEMIRQLIHIAHEEGFSVMAHANGARTVQAAAEAGVNSIEHGAYLDSDALSAMAENRVIWVPTLSTVGNLLETDRFPHKEVSAILEHTLERVSRFSQMGGLLAPGTDAGAYAVPHGILSEYQLFENLFGEEADARLQPGITALQAQF